MATMSTPTKPRPGLPDVKWTPRQKQVLDLLMKRYTNGQIGQELGISLDGAKWHVSEIISILGVDSREEAADYWREYNGLPARLRRVAAGLFTGTAALRWAAAAGVLGLAVVTGIVFATLQSLGGEETPAAQETVTAVPGGAVTPVPSPAAVATPTVDTGAGGSYAGFSIAASAETIPSTVVYQAQGCWGCDGPDAGLVRYVVDAQGATRIEDLRPTTLAAANGWAISAYSAAPDGSMLAFAACEDTEYCGGLGPFRPELRWRIFWSFDGGMSWSVAGEYVGHAWIRSIENGRMLVSEYSPEQERYFLVTAAGSRRVEAPAGAAEHSGATLLRDGRVLFHAANRKDLLNEDGSVFIAAPSDIDRQTWYVSEQPDGSIRVGWNFVPSGPRPDPADGFVEAVYNSQGMLLSTERVYEDFVPTGYLGDEYAFGNLASYQLDRTPYGNYPVLYDLRAGTVTPILGWFEESRRNRMLALVPGDFLRVANTGDCLNVRAEADTDAEVLSCYRDGVLLRDRGETREAGGVTWRAVTAPDGREGWASGEFLEE